MAKPIGEILIEQGSITNEQLSRALEQQKLERGKRRLGEVLIEMGLITESDIVIALSTQFNYPYLSLASITPNPDVHGIVPVEVVRKRLAIPIDKQGSLLTVVMADPSDEETLQELEKLSKCKIQTFISTLSEIENATGRLYDDPQHKKTQG